MNEYRPQLSAWEKLTTTTEISVQQAAVIKQTYALLAMSGASAQPLPMMRVVAGQAMRKKPGRTEYQRGIVSTDAEGRQTVCITGAQGSGILRSMSEANGLIVLHHDQGSVAAGDLVDVMPFHGLM